MTKGHNTDIIFFFTKMSLSFMIICQLYDQFFDKKNFFNGFIKILNFLCFLRYFFETNI